MPQYDFRNKETGEVTEVLLRISEYDQYLSDNPEWERYFAVGSGPKIVAGVKSPMRMAGKGWETHLTNIKKGSGRDNSIKV
jgi:hypothetical protein